MLFVSLLLGLYFAASQSVISVFGGSVANGVGCSGNCSGRNASSSSNPGGCYQSRLKVFQATKGRTVFNNCNNGDTSTALIARFGQVLAVNPSFVLIAIGLDNEGLLGRDPQNAFDLYANGLQTLVNMSRARNIAPVIGMAYPNNAYSPMLYSYVKRMNLLIQSWNVPSINFLGAIDNGKGQWASGYFAESSLPNEQGSTLMYHALVPSLWEAIEQGQPATPRSLLELNTSATLSCSNGISGYSRLSFMPTESAVYSWTMSITLDPDSATEPSGGFATIIANGTNASLWGNFSLDAGKFVYSSLRTNVSLDDALSHQITVSHNYPSKITKVYVDGVLRGQVAEQLAPQEFVLNGDLCITYPLIITHWLIYRSALNEDEVFAMYNQSLVLPASLEVYAPLDELAMNDNKALSLSNVAITSILPTISVAPTTRAPTKRPTSLQPTRSPTVEVPTEPPEDESSYSAQIAIFSSIVGLLVLGLIGWKVYKCHQLKQVGVVDLGQDTEMK